MIRIIVETCDAGMAANTNGGTVLRTFRTFDLAFDKPHTITVLRDLEDFLHAGNQAHSYIQRQVQGVELID